MTTVAIVDCETTGVGASDEPIAIGVIVVALDARGAVEEEVGVFHGFREPSVPIHPQAQKVHGISAESLKGKQIDVTHLRGLLDKADVLIAHNAPFDARMLAQVVAIDKPWRCSYRQFPWPPMGNKKLDTVCEEYQIERPGQHDALQDARALLACLTQRTGKTDRSRTYMHKLLGRQEFDVTPTPRRPRQNYEPRELRMTIDLGSMGYAPDKPTAEPPKEKQSHHRLIIAAVLVLLVAWMCSGGDPAPSKTNAAPAAPASSSAR